MFPLSFIPLDWYYPFFAVFLWLFALVLIPKNKMKPLFWYGFVWGFLAAYVFAWIFGSGLKLFNYKLAEPFKPFGVCIWLSFAWAAAIMIYLQYLPPKNLWYAFPAYLIVFALASASLDEVFHTAKLLEYTGWHPLYRFILAIFWFWGTKAHFIATKATFLNSEEYS